jgi:hypothetical protein
MAPSRNDPGVTEIGPVGTAVGLLPPNAQAILPSSSLNHAAQRPGGVWFDLNGNLTWAYGTLDGVVPGARGLAWDEYTRNTLARHATVFPDHWQGTISVDDVCHAHYADDPERCGTGLSSAYDGQITEQPTWMVMDAIRLAGITTTRDGVDVSPHLPFTRFSFRMPRIGVARETRRLRGYITPESSGRVRIAVHLPAGGDPARITAWSGERSVQPRIDGTVVRLTVQTTRGRAADWAVAW